MRRVCVCLSYHVTYSNIFLPMLLFVSSAVGDLTPALEIRPLSVLR